MSDQQKPHVRERLTIGFIPKASRDLAERAAAEGLSKADVVNRAIAWSNSPIRPRPKINPSGALMTSSRDLVP